MPWYNELADVEDYRKFVKFITASSRSAQSLLSLDLRIAEMEGENPRHHATWKNGKDTDRPTKVVEMMWFHFADKQPQATWSPEINRQVNAFMEQHGPPDTTRLAAVVAPITLMGVDLDDVYRTIRQLRTTRVREATDKAWHQYKKAQLVLGDEAGDQSAIDVKKAQKAKDKLFSHMKMKLDGVVRGGHDSGQFWFGGPVMTGPRMEDDGSGVFLVSSAILKPIDAKYIGEAELLLRANASVSKGLFLQTEKKKKLLVALLSGDPLRAPMIKTALAEMGCKARTVEIVDAATIREAVKTTK